MNQDPKPHGPTDDPENQSHESRIDVPIFEASNWRPQPFRAARFYTTSQMAKILSCDPSTLRRYRRLEEPPGPKATFISQRVWRYYHNDFVDWLSKRNRPKDAA